MSRHQSAVTHTMFMGSIYPINCGEYFNQKTDVVILGKILAQVEAMLSHHNKVLVFRFDLHTTDYTPNNILLGRFFEKSKAYAVRHYGVVRFGYAWVREQERAKGQHYQCFIVLDANKVRSSKKLLGYMSRRWSFDTDSILHIPKRHSYIVMRDDKNGQMANMVYRLSYLSKARGKGYAEKNARDFTTSRVKMNDDLNFLRRSAISHEAPLPQLEEKPDHKGCIISEVSF